MRLLSIAFAAIESALEQITRSGDQGADAPTREWPLEEAGALAIAALKPLIGGKAHPVLVGSQGELLFHCPDRPLLLDRAWVSGISPGLQALSDPRRAISAAIQQISDPTHLVGGAAKAQLIASHDSRSGHALTAENDLPRVTEWPLNWWVRLGPTTHGPSTSISVSRSSSDGSLIASAHG